MTDFRLTQGAVEEWARGTPRAQVTQVAIEQWAQVSSVNTQMVLTQIATEQWGSVMVVSPGAGFQARAMLMA